MSEEKYEFLFKGAIQNVKKTTSSELTKEATLIAISVDLEKVPMEEQEAFYKVYNKYKKIVAETTERMKWMRAYSEVKQRFENLYKLTYLPPQGEERKSVNKLHITTPEQQEFWDHYREIYSQLK